MNFIRKFQTPIMQYGVITGNYWLFTLTDGALRMLVVLHFFTLGYSPLKIAMLFVLYEAFGVVTNIFGGWLGAKIGLNKTMNLGLLMQIIALSMLLVPVEYLTVTWLMIAQALSGIAKDLNKMSAKSSIKTLLVKDTNQKMYQWVAGLTGSKNTLKGVGFFLGGSLLALLGFRGAILALVLPLMAIWLFSLVALQTNLGKSKNAPKITSLLAKSDQINWLSSARFFLFASRDVWFVIALPLFLADQFSWPHWQVGAYFACWVIFYGFIQGFSPKFSSKLPDGKTALSAIIVLLIICLCISLLVTLNWKLQYSLLISLLVFAVVFAVNSAQHSYLIVHYADSDSVSLDVGFYYMANAAGRLSGTVLSGLLYQKYGFMACIIASSVLVLLGAICTYKLTKIEMQ